MPGAAGWSGGWSAGLSCGANAELAARGLARFDATGLSLIGTLRRDGSPRISAVEPFIFDGELALGMMWRSMKALDLLRDPRCVVHSTISDKDGTEGEFKVYGRAVAVDDPATRARYCFGSAGRHRVGTRG